MDLRKPSILNTPPFEKVVGVSLERGDASQRVGMLKPLLEAAGPAATSPLLGQHAPAQDDSLPVESRLASYLHPKAVERLARHAAQADPAVAHKMSNLYAGDPELGKTLSKLAENR